MPGHPRFTTNATLAALIALVCFTTLPVAAAADGLSAPDVVRETNAVRSRNGLGHLSIDSRLTRAAQAKADDMAARGYFAHRTPDGRMPWDWIESAGYDFVAAAENLAVGFPDDAAVVAAWMASDGHRHNLLNQKYTDVGIGIARGKYKGQDTVFVVQLFGRPRAARPAAVLRAAAIPLVPFLAPAAPLAARPLSLDVPPLLPVLLRAQALSFGLADAPALVLEAAAITVEPYLLPAVALESASLPIGLSVLAAVPLEATPVAVGMSVLPSGVQPAEWGSTPIAPTF